MQYAVKMFRKIKIPRPIVVLGVVSLLNDMASEMIAPIMPIFLTTVLQASIPAVGVVEGVAEATASLTKYLFGRWSDKLQKRKPFVVAGYAFGAISKVLIALATAWGWVLGARFIDRLGKGLRTAARDSIITANAPLAQRAELFGFHRAMDTLGAVLGPLLALLILAFATDNLRLVFLLAFIPGALCVSLLVRYIRELKPPVVDTAATTAVTALLQSKNKLRWSNVPAAVKWFLFVNVIFALGNSSDAFIILRGQDLGLSLTIIILMYVCYNAVSSVFSTPVGRLADHLGPKRVVIVGWLVFVVVYGGFGIIANGHWLWLLFPIYGLYVAFTDGIGRAYMSSLVPLQQSGTYFGLYHGLISFGNLAASVVGGLLWSYYQPAVTFFYGAAFALLAVILFAFTSTKTNSKLAVSGLDVSVRTAS